jgi:HD-GYP domain-containing protein (c-di-GMP phosphodiesterase class II)
VLRLAELILGVALGALYLRERQARQRAERFAAAGLESLLRAIDANDHQTGAHVRRVAAYSLIIADALGLDYDERRIVELTALFHDVGKIHEALFDLVHDAGTLTPAERRAITTHPARGADVLAPIAQFHPLLADAVLAHHEWWNGKGYPRQLSRGRIPLAARIVAIADTFDVVTYGRRYRDGRGSDEAAHIILEGRATQFDPELVDLVTLPPVFARMTAAMRRAHRRGERIPSRAAHHETEKAPRIRIRWRTRTDSPAPVRGELRGKPNRPHRGKRAGRAG